MISSENTGNRSQPFQFQLKPSEPAVYERIYDDYGQELFVAGQFVAAGTYLEVDSNRQVTLDRPGPLPASLNGRRAYYSRLERPWIRASANHPITTSRN
jgi:hypothetical protein